MNEHSHVRIESPAFSAGSVQLIEMEGREAISRLFEVHVMVACSDPAGLDIDAAIGAQATLVFERGGKETRRMGGIIAAIRDSMHEETGKPVYNLWFAPRAFRMGLVETYEIFMDLSVPDIVKKKLERAGLIENEDFLFRLTATYPPREFVVQYKETDLAFVSRLLEHLGISFFFEHHDGVDVWVLTDDNASFSPAVGGKEVPFHARGDRTGVFRMESQTRMTPAEYRVKDYNYRTPQLPLQASAPTEKGDGGYVIEYGAHFKNPDEGARIAKVRAEELTASRTVVEGKSDQHGFFAGAQVVVEGHPRGDVPLLLTEVSHRAVTGALGAGRELARDYENTFKAIPFKTPFRPARITPKPRIHGVITGVIDAAAKGPYAELDADGRYRVRFLFDAGEAEDGKASRLCRMSQPHGGGGYGMHFPLRSGVEVILTFVEGDPDRPIIVGVVPNPQTPSPVTAGNGARNIIRTGGGNEINIDDTAGSERIKLSTPYAKSVIQIGDKNASEEGITNETNKNVSTNAKQSINMISPMLGVTGDYFKILSASDNTQYCTAFVNVMALTEAIVGGLGNAAEIGKAGYYGSRKEWIESAKKLADEKESAARAQKHEIEELQPGIDARTKPMKDAQDERRRKLAEKQDERAKKQAQIDAKEAERRRKIAERDRKMSSLEARKKAKSAREGASSGALGLFGKAFGGSSGTESLDREIGEIEAEIQTLSDEITALDNEIAPLKGELSTIDSEIAALSTEISDAGKAIAEVEKPVTDRQANIKEAEEGAEIAKRLADERQAEMDEEAVSKADEAIETYAGGLGGPLMSTVTDYATYLAQLEADAVAEGLTMGAAYEAGHGRICRIVPPVLGSPKFIGGGTANGSLVGGRNAFVGGGMQATLYGGYTAQILAKMTVTMKAPQAEVYGESRLYLTSKLLIDLESDKDVNVTAKQGAITAKAGTTVDVTAEAEMTATAKGICVTSKKDLALDVVEGPTTITAKKGPVTLTAIDGTLSLSGNNGPSYVELSKDSTIVHHKNWGLVAEKDSINIGPIANKNKDLWLTPKTITMKRDGGVISVANNNVALKGGNTTLTLANSGFVVNGTRIDLG